MAESGAVNDISPNLSVNSINMDSDLPMPVKKKSSLHIPLIYGNYILLSFGKIMKPVLIDTGASISMVNLKLLNHLNKNLHSKIQESKLNHAKLVDGSDIKIMGVLDLNLFIMDRKIKFKFQVIQSMEYWAILGKDFLQKYQASVNYFYDSLIFPKSFSKEGLEISNPSVGACKTGQNSKEIEICEAPQEAHDMAYYQKAAIPTFSNYEDEQMNLPKRKVNSTPPPVPLDLSNTILNDEQKQKLRNLIKKYRNAFAVDDTELGRTHVYRHKLKLKPGAQPPRPKLYQTNAKDREIIKKHLDDMLANDIIKPVSEGVFSSPTLLVPKKDGGLRYCADLRDMNKILEEDVYPLPLIRNIIDALGTSKATIYSIVDLRSAFWQIEVHPSSQKYLTINTHMGRFAFKVLPFGLHSSPSAFQRLMNTVLRGILWDFAIPFLDDVVIFSPDPVSHLFHLEEVFKRLTEAGLKLKPQKCQFGVSYIKYLGHNIGKKGIAPFEEKVKAVKDFVTPTTITQIKSFLGLANYYRKFIKDFSKLAKPLNDLTKKSKTFYWTENCQNSFMELKRRLISAPVLAHANPNLPYRLTTDASKTGLGWVLEQEQEGKYKVICYGGKSLTGAQSNYGISDLEALAVVTAIKDLDCYLRYQKFTIMTDHQPLKYMLTNPTPPPGRWSRWIALLSPYQFTVEYLKGSANKVADSLSRQKHKAIATDNDELESYLCAMHIHSTDGKNTDFLNGQVLNGCYINKNSNKPLSEQQKAILATSHQVSLPYRESDSAQVSEDTESEANPICEENECDILEDSQTTEVVLATKTETQPKTFRRIRNWHKYKAPKTKIMVGRTDPASIPADCIFNFTTNQLKPTGPVSKSIQLAGGPDYKKSLQTSLNKNGLLNMGSVRRIEGGCTNVLWIYNINLPKYQLGKQLAPNTIYKVLTNALEIAAKSKVKKLIISPTDLISLNYTSTKAVELISQIIWDYCQSDKPQMEEIIISIQTLSMADKTGKIFQKFQKEPDLKIFQIVKIPTAKEARSKLNQFRGSDTYITNPQEMIEELNLSEGFSQLDYDVDPDIVRKMQLKDEHYSLLMNYLKDEELPVSEKLAKRIRKDSQNYELIGGILYNFWVMPRRSDTDRARFRLCVPAELRHRLMYAYHDAPISAHRSAEKMYYLMKMSYFWKGMFSDIQNWTQSCIRCSKVKAIPRSRRAKLQPIMEHRPFAMVNVDLIGPMEHSAEQYRYVLTMVDRATRYCFAVPIPDGTAVTIAKAIFSEVISKFGLVDCIVSDRGLNFTSPIVQHLCSLLGTKRILTSAYRPSSNGLVESFNGVFKQKLLTLAGEYPNTWPQYVDGVLYALRTTVVDSLGYSPFELLFAREPKLLLEIGPDVLKTHPSLTVRKYLANLRTQMNYLRDSAVEIEKKQKQKMKDDYDKFCRPFEYQEGDRVWIRSPQSTPGSTKKFRDKYVGPFILGTRTSNNTFKVRREDTNVLSEVAIHSDRFKPCISRYAKPEYMPGLVDEELVGTELPLTLCTEDDFINTEEPKVELVKSDTSSSQELSEDESKDKEDKSDAPKISENKAPKLKDPINDKLEQIMKQLDDIQGNKEKSPSQDVTEDNLGEYYPVERIIRGKYTPEGVKYLIKWKGYSSRHNTWEKEEDLSPDTLQELKGRPVRMYGRKPKGNITNTSQTLDTMEDDVDPDMAHKGENSLINLTEQELQEAYDADTDIDSDTTEIYDY